MNQDSYEESHAKAQRGKGAKKAKSEGQRAKSKEQPRINADRKKQAFTTEDTEVHRDKTKRNLFLALPSN